MVAGAPAWEPVGNSHRVGCVIKVIKADQAPEMCPYGHPLGVRRVLVGWSPCECPPALGAHRGHRTYECLACSEQHQRCVCYVPHHVPPAGALSRWP
jgi:hypothetical protein